MLCESGVVFENASEVLVMLLLGAAAGYNSRSWQAPMKLKRLHRCFTDESDVPWVFCGQRLSGLWWMSQRLSSATSPQRDGLLPALNMGTANKYTQGCTSRICQHNIPSFTSFTEDEFILCMLWVTGVFLQVRSQLVTIESLRYIESPFTRFVHWGGGFSVSPLRFCSGCTWLSLNSLSIKIKH